MNPKLILIEDDVPIASSTIEYLENYGFCVEHFVDGRLGYEAVLKSIPDLVLLDLMLPSMDGLEICRLLRQEPATRAIPIIMLTARGHEMDRVVGLEMGADDYLPKPFSLRELVARIRGALRRTSFVEPEEASNETSKSPVNPLLQIDRETRKILWKEQDIELTSTEFELLWFLLQNQGKVCSRDQLLDHARGRDFEVFDRSIDVHISKIRKKIELDPKNPQYLKTIWGIGYQLILTTG